VTEPIRYRPSWRQYPGWLLLLPAAQLVTMVVVDMRREARVIYLVTWLVLAVGVRWGRTLGVDVTEDALVMHGLRRRVLPWRRIDWVGEVSQLGTHRVAVRCGGRLRMLRAPYHHRLLAPDPDFEAKVRTIHDAWARATSAGSAP
jgi:hypothetical protein